MNNRAATTHARIVAASVLLAATIGARAATYTETWPVAGNLRGWELIEDFGGAAFGSLSCTNTFGNPAPALRVSASTIGVMFPRTDRLRATVSSGGTNFTGNYMHDGTAPVLSTLSFDLFINVAPLDALQLYFVGNGFTWFHELSGPTNGWNRFSVDFDASDWTDLGAGGNFFGDATDVSEIGIRFTYRTSTAGQLIGLDNLTRSGKSLVWHVKHNAAGANLGSSWSNAFKDVQDALVLASAYGGEIWVAAGTYYPDRASAGAASVTNNNRNSTFTLFNNALLYGGFAGTETNRASRAPATHVTVLSGDLDGNDATNHLGIITNSAPGSFVGSNAWHVVTCPNAVAAPATLDGFTITAGHANGASIFTNNAAGIFALGRLNLANCTVTGNRAAYTGGGASFEADTTVSNCTFRANAATRGGGFAVGAGSTVVADSTIAGNTVTSEGGGIFAQSAFVTGIRCTIAGNTAGSGGGLLAQGGASTRLLNCRVTGNAASGNGGGADCRDSHANWVNCTFSGNFATGGGGAFRTANNADALIVNSIFHSNQAAGTTATVSATISNAAGNSIVFANCLVANSGGSGGGWPALAGADGGSNIDTNALFVTALAPTSSGSTNGNFRLQGISLARNAGNNNADIDGSGPSTNTIASEPTDLAGVARVSNGTVDMGAYESLDTDNDGLSDWEEINLYGSSTNDTDSDNDGVGDWAEAMAGSNPNDPASRFEFIAVADGASTVAITWESASNRLYRVLRSTNLVNGAWIQVTNNIPATPPQNTLTNTAPGSLPHFYRIQVQ